MKRSRVKVQLGNVEALRKLMNEGVITFWETSFMAKQKWAVLGKTSSSSLSVPASPENNDILILVYPRGALAVAITTPNLGKQ